MTLRGWCAGLGVLALIAGCSSEPEQVEPAAAGERWESCQARNDCAEGLACIENQCVQNDFPISVDAKHCYRVD